MTDIRKVKDEIERRIRETADTPAPTQCQKILKTALIGQLSGLLKFIDTMFQEIDAVNVRNMMSCTPREEYMKGYGDAMRDYFGKMKDVDFEAFLCRKIKEWQNSGDNPESEEFRDILSNDAAWLLDIARRSNPNEELAKAEVLQSVPKWKHGTPPHKGWWLTKKERTDGGALVACEPWVDDKWPHEHEDNVSYMDMNELKYLPAEQ